MQVGDLVRLKGLSDGTYGTVRAGEYLIYVGKGSWYGWGRFLLPDGRSGQIQLTDVEVL